MWPYQKDTIARSGPDASSRLDNPVAGLTLAPNSLSHKPFPRKPLTCQQLEISNNHHVLVVYCTGSMTAFELTPPVVSITG